MNTFKDNICKIISDTLKKDASKDIDYILNKDGTRAIRIKDITLDEFYFITNKLSKINIGFFSLIGAEKYNGYYMWHFIPLAYLK